MDDGENDDDERVFVTRTVQNDIDRTLTAARRQALARITWTDSRGPHDTVISQRATIGAATALDIVIADATVSRLHAELDPREDGVWIRDLGSRNGTFVERLMIKSGRLWDGARVRVGSTVLNVQQLAEQQTIPLWPHTSFGPLVGRSAAMREMFVRLARVAESDATVLIHGETGTGKELVARAIHEASPRSLKPLVVVDCAALPENLLEAELFGHARGSFTGAVGTRDGAIESADGGTVFLDEIGELPLSMQPKLLRVIESRAVRRIGESQYRSVDVRFLAATHRDLREMVNNGSFREDLYFRLAVLPVTVPPLRARPDDIPWLIQHFLPHGTQPLGPTMLEDLAARPWSGNVRELRNFVERMAVLGAPEALALSAADSARGRSSSVPGAATLRSDLPIKEAREEWVAAFEREYLAALVARVGRDANAVAKAAGLEVSWARKMLRKNSL